MQRSLAATIVGTVGMMSASACGSGPTTGASQPAYAEGLQQTAQVVLPNDMNGTPHSTAMLVAPDTGRLFLSDSGGGIVAYDPGSATPVFHAADPTNELSCSVLAYHAPSRSLYCSALPSGDIGIVDASTGAVRKTNSAALSTYGFRGLAVIGDHLFAAKVPSGIEQRIIASDGSLGAPEQVLDGAFQQLAAFGDTLYAAGTGLGLVAITHDGASTPVVSFDGPALGMRIRDGRAALALGSAGALVVDLASRQTTPFHPNCVVVSADVAGDVLAAGCYSGLVTYDLAKKRVFGFHPAVFGMMDVMLDGSTVKAVDWWFLDTFALNPGGSATCVEAQPGYLIAPGKGISFNVRNMGDLPLHVPGVALSPYGTGMLEAKASAGTVDVRTAEESASQEANVILASPPNLVGIGDPFPMPTLSGKMVYFTAGTCAIQWPALDDLAWLAAQGRPPRGRVPVLVVDDSSTSAEGVNPWVTTGMPKIWSPLQVVALGALLPGLSGGTTYNARFWPGSFIPGGDNESDYWVDGDGTVEWFERNYSGAFAGP